MEPDEDDWPPSPMETLHFQAMMHKHVFACQNSLLWVQPRQVQPSRRAEKHISVFSATRFLTTPTFLCECSWKMFLQRKSFWKCSLSQSILKLLWKLASCNSRSSLKRSASAAKKAPQHNFKSFIQPPFQRIVLKLYFKEIGPQFNTLQRVQEQRPLSRHWIKIGLKCLIGTVSFWALRGALVYPIYKWKCDSARNGNLRSLVSLNGALRIKT